MEIKLVGCLTSFSRFARYQRFKREWRKDIALTRVEFTLEFDPKSIKELALIH